MWSNDSDAFSMCDMHAANLSDIICDTELQDMEYTVYNAYSSNSQSINQFSSQNVNAFMQMTANELCDDKCESVNLSTNMKKLDAKVNGIHFDSDIVRFYFYL